MARINGVQQADADLKVKLVYRFMRKGMTKLTGRAPASGRSGIEPIEVWAHQPKLLSSMGKFQQAVRKAHAVDERLKNLVEVTDELFARIKEHFSNPQLVEITALLTVVNLDRFNAAFGIGSAGFSDGMVCVPPDRPAANPPVARIP
ncbi:MAG TPA: hypothetical protein VG365_01985 [Solirubrobacteraceae bacterium]|jgi:hypothetical protein|nr:hypothetical protein [Solirubrobacteraceae bacterium]